MKTLFSFLFVALSSAVVSAAPQEIPAAKLDLYKRSVIVALINGDFLCRGEGYSFQTRVDMSTSATIDMTGTQPILKFRRVIKHVGGNSNEAVESYEEISVISKGDFKNIENIASAIYRLKDVEHGTLLNPQITKEYVADDSICFCRAKPVSNR